MKKPNKKRVVIICIAIVLIVALIITLVLMPKTVNYNEEVVRTQDIATYYSFMVGHQPEMPAI